MAMNFTPSSSSSTVQKSKTVGFLNLNHRKEDGSVGASIGTTGIVFTDKARDAGTVKRLNEGGEAAIAALVAKIKSGEIIFTWYDATTEKAAAEAAF